MDKTHKSVFNIISIIGKNPDQLPRLSFICCFYTNTRKFLEVYEEGSYVKIKGLTALESVMRKLLLNQRTNGPENDILA